MAEYTFFSSAHETFIRIDHFLHHKSSLGKFRKIEIISYIFFTDLNMFTGGKKKLKRHKHKETKQCCYVAKRSLKKSKRKKKKKNIEISDSKITTQNL